MNQFREILATKNIYPAPTETVMYRYTYEEILIDFIPYEATTLGPTNPWLKPGFEKAVTIEIGQTAIKILPVSLFIASKWEAFKNRGGDPRLSHDFEDIIYVIDNNLNFVEDSLNAEKNVQVFLKEMCQEILLHSSKNEIIECHLNPYTAVERKELIFKKLEEILNSTIK